MRVVDAYSDLAESHGIDPAQMALAFCLTRPFVATVIIGATSLAQLESNIAAVDVSLGDEVLSEIQALHHRHPMPI